MRKTHILAAVAASVAFAAPAVASDQIRIFAGSSTGFYTTVVGAGIDRILDAEGFDAEVVVSDGSIMNGEAILADQTAIGIMSRAAFAEFNAKNPGMFIEVRSDIGKECLFGVTRRTDWSTWGDYAADARRFNLAITGPKSGGVAAFLSLRERNDRLQRLDMNGNKVAYTGGSSEVVDAVASGNADFGFFELFPMPGLSAFTKAREAGLNFVSVGSRSMTRIQVAGEQAYEIVDVSFVDPGRTEPLFAACSGVTIVMGNPENLPEGSDARWNADDALAMLSEADVTEFQPKEEAQEEPSGGFWGTVTGVLSGNISFAAAFSDAMSSMETLSADATEAFSPLLRLPRTADPIFRPCSPYGGLFYWL